VALTAARQRAKTVAALESLGAIAVVRLDDATQLMPVVEALAAGGVRAIETTATTPHLFDVLGRMKPAMRDELVIGVGSVLDAETARLAILSGARFVVSPVCSPAVVEVCHRYDVTVMPGGLTPTELLAAWQLGADLVKLFPAAPVGPGFLHELKGPLPQLRLVPTGGVNLENAGAFLEAGAVAVGVGGALFPSEAMARGDYGKVSEQAGRLTRMIRAAREHR
jgi:2-dehydro-3-deoxyphosphogluconate aldolase/(4S)-4-hydroxy-2-oxoglutarate aldolase